MRKFSNALLLIAFFWVATPWAFAQDMEGDTTEVVSEEDTAAVEEEVTPAAEEPEEVAFEEPEEMPVEAPSFHQRVKEKFIEGGWEFMGIVLVCLILGLAIAIERIITLNIATTNTKKLLDG